MLIFFSGCLNFSKVIFRQTTLLKLQRLPRCVNGITADYDTDGKYWAFYINGEYATTGVDATEIDEEAVYTFAVEG